MPRGNPKIRRMFGITQVRIDAVKATGVPLTRLVEEGIDLWLARSSGSTATRSRRHPLAPPRAGRIRWRKGPANVSPSAS